MLAFTNNNFTIAQNSSTTGGIRIADTSVLIGCGGTSDIPTCNTVYNSPDGQSTTTTANGTVIQTNDITPFPTLVVKETTTNKALYVVPNSVSGSYNGIDSLGATELIGYNVGKGADNGQSILIAPHSDASCGLRASAGVTGSTAAASCIVGCGGQGYAPTQSIEFQNNHNNSGSGRMIMRYTNIEIDTTTDSGAGNLAGKYLPVIINGVTYKIGLFNNN
jgi:hypothetical protein